MKTNHKASHIMNNLTTLAIAEMFLVLEGHFAAGLNLAYCVQCKLFQSAQYGNNKLSNMFVCVVRTSAREES